MMFAPIIVNLALLIFYKLAGWDNRDALIFGSIMIWITYAAVAVLDVVAGCMGWSMIIDID